MQKTHQLLTREVVTQIQLEPGRLVKPLKKLMHEPRASLSQAAIQEVVTQEVATMAAVVISRLQTKMWLS